METLLFVYGLAGSLLPLTGMSVLGWFFLLVGLAVFVSGWVSWCRSRKRRRLRARAARVVPVDDLLGGDR